MFSKVAVDEALFLKEVATFWRLCPHRWTHARIISAGYKDVNAHS